MEDTSAYTEYADFNGSDNYRGATPRESYLLDEVKTADLTKYTDANLAGRLADYERKYTFETNQSIRAEFKIERDRTRTEINRRKMYQTREADRVFKL